MLRELKHRQHTGSDANRDCLSSLNTARDKCSLGHAHTDTTHGHNSIITHPHPQNIKTKKGQFEISLYHHTHPPHTPHTHTPHTTPPPHTPHTHHHHHHHNHHHPSPTPTHTHTPPHTPTHPLPYTFMASIVDHVFAIQPRTHKSDFLRLIVDKMAEFLCKIAFSHANMTNHWVMETLYFKGERWRISQMHIYVILRSLPISDDRGQSSIKVRPECKG